MTDIVERLQNAGEDFCKDGPVWPGDDMLEAANEIESLRKQLREANASLAECQAREKVLRDFVDVCIELDDYLTITVTDALDKVRDLPSDSTELNTMLKAAKRDALLDAKHVAENMMALGYKIEAIVGDISNMAKELE